MPDGGIPQPMMHPEMPLFRTLQYGWFVAAMVHSYGEFLSVFAKEHASAAWLQEPLHYHHAVAFFMVSVLLVLSILTLRPESIRYQIGHLVWTMLALLLTVGQMMKAAYMVHEACFFFFFPAWLVINNDCWAYFWGMLFGKKIINRPFLRLSPNKTWEGFIGAFFSTVIVSFYSSSYFSQFTWMSCPSTDLTTTFHPVSACTMPAVFVQGDVVIPGWLATVTGGLLQDTMVLKPIQLHAIGFAVFASSVAPFGGFLASAIKRANHVKDFDSVIPGHGGFTDRMDCQMVMSIFVWVYYVSFMSAYTSPADKMMEEWGRLPVADQTDVFRRISQAIAS